MSLKDKDDAENLAALFDQRDERRKAILADDGHPTFGRHVGTPAEWYSPVTEVIAERTFSVRYDVRLACGHVTDCIGLPGAQDLIGRALFCPTCREIKGKETSHAQE